MERKGRANGRESTQPWPLPPCSAVPRILALPKHGSDGLLGGLSIPYLLLPSLFPHQTLFSPQISPSMCHHGSTAVTNSKATITSTLVFF